MKRIAPVVPLLFGVACSAPNNGSSSESVPKATNEASSSAAETPEPTRLFLGFADGYFGIGPPGWYGNNSGEFRATIALTKG